MLVKTSDRVKRKNNVQKCYLSAPKMRQPTAAEYNKALRSIQLEVIYNKLRIHDDAWYQSCLTQAADTFAKKQYIKNEMTLNQYREHERKTYGTINA